MGWRVIGASVIGRSHEAAGTLCEDYHAVRVVDAAGGPVVILALADGAGSAAASLYGAKTAVDAAVRAVAGDVKRGAGSLALETLRDACADARASVFQTVDEFGHVASDYSSTLILVVASPERTLAAHIGDGAVVIEDDALRVLSFPEQGEYANATRFLVDDDALTAARLVEHGAVRRIAVLSDGLQRIALEYASRSAYAPFFTPIFERVEAEGETSDRLAAQLEAWLASDAVNARTDDDKSLVVAVRTP